LRSLFHHWVMLAPTEAAVERKIARYFPDGLDQFWGKYLVAGTPERIGELFQAYVDAGTQHIDCQVLDSEDEETITLIMTEIAPRMRSAVS
jgi:hypothetical protein